ncbi:MAG: hypothetical protein Q8Q33_01580 [Chlamydiota bacterium]|nr:hypothetical protein [Chlamydiota bacterium]
MDEPVVMRDDTSFYYFTHDGLGSISEITDSSGDIVEYYDYDAYGSPTLYDASDTVISLSTVDNPYYFTGREFQSGRLVMSLG